MNSFDLHGGVKTQFNWNSLPKIGGASDSFMLLLASLLPPPLALRRAEAVSSGVNCHADFCTDISLI